MRYPLLLTSRMRSAMKIHYAWAGGEGTYLFVPEDRVDDQVAIMTAFHEATTWGEFWGKLPPTEAATVREGMAWRWEEDDDSAPDAAFPYDGDTAMDVRVLPGVEDGDWPPMLNQQITEWFPRELLRDLKGLSSGPASGTSLTVGPSDLADVAAAFTRHGYRLVSAPELVSRASGWWWQGKTLRAEPDER